MTLSHIILRKVAFPLRANGSAVCGRGLMAYFVQMTGVQAVRQAKPEKAAENEF